MNESSNEHQALDVLLARAIDMNTSGAPHVAASVRDACSIETAHECDLQDDPTPSAVKGFIVHRAGMLLDRARSEAPEIDRLRALHPPRWALPTLVLVAFMAGLASHALGDGKRINLLLAPLLVILIWNVIVYVVLAARRFGSREHGSIVSSIAQWHWRRTMGSKPTAFQDVFKAWLLHAAPIIDARIGVALHSAAAALAIGAITSMYVRGLGVEYLAGWESTFLDEHGVRRILSVALSIGSLITGIEIGDAARIASLRFSNGAGGAPAGPWIHLYAATAAVVIVVPRLVLVTLARMQVRTLANRFPISLDDAYVRQLLRTISKKSNRIVAMPVAMAMDADIRDALQSALEEKLGGRVDLAIGDAIPYGGTIASRTGDDEIVLVFAAAATPEPEVHGALIDAAKPIAVVIDETAMQRRFGADRAMVHRIEERRNAWRALVADAKIEPVFIGARMP